MAFHKTGVQSTSRRIPAGIDSIVETKVAVVICTVLSDTDNLIFGPDTMNRCEAVRKSTCRIIMCTLIKSEACITEREERDQKLCVVPLIKPTYIKISLII